MIHRPEHEFASKLAGRLRYQPHVWPPGLDPTLVDLQPKPFGPFPQSYPVTEAGDVQLVPLPGHSVAQVGVALLAGERTLLFAADHILRLDWFDEDCRAGWLRGLGAFFPGPAEESSRRLHAYASETTTVVLPSHDTETPDRLATLETWQPPPIGAKAS